MANSLTDAEQRRRVESWIISGQATITAADTMYELLRGTEWEASRRIVREVWAEVKTGLGYIPLINRLPEEEYIPRSWIRQTDAELRENYLVKYRVSGIDAITHEFKWQYVSLEYDRLPSKGEIGEDSSQFIYRYLFSMEPGLTDITLLDVAHKRGLSW
jgi:hypothetical protein